jgi:hypothetical protein
VASDETGRKQAIAIEQQLKFNYSISALIFGTLALSVQFSPKMGTLFPYLLVLAWFCLVVSAIAAGFILMRLYTVDALTDVFNWVDLQGVYKKTFFIRLWGFLVGVVFNLVFAAVNYLGDIQKASTLTGHS